MDAFRGIYLVARTPRLWPLCAVPLLAAFTLYAVLGVLGGMLLVPRLPGWLGRGETASGLTQLLGGAAFLLLWLVLFQFAFALFAGVFSGLIWDRLSLEVERIAALADKGAVPDAAKIGCGAQAGDTFARFLLAATLGALSFVAGCPLGPVGAVAASVLGLLDYCAPAYLRRGRTLGPQWAHLRRAGGRDALGFALVAGLLSLVPLAGVLFAPGLVAGGTLLARRVQEPRDKMSR
jgi:uncharacterized protein involved in cysteine biosynthesis